MSYEVVFDAGEGNYIARGQRVYRNSFHKRKEAEDTLSRLQLEHREGKGNIIEPDFILLGDGLEIDNFNTLSYAENGFYATVGRSIMLKIHVEVFLYYKGNLHLWWMEPSL